MKKGVQVGKAGAKTYRKNAYMGSGGKSASMAGAVNKMESNLGTKVGLSCKCLAWAGIMLKEG